MNLSATRMEDFFVTHSVTVASLQATEDQRRHNGQRSQRHERFVNAVNHFDCIGLTMNRNEERCRQSRRRDAEADRHLLHSARNGTGGARFLITGVGIDKRVHARVLQLR